MVDAHHPVPISCFLQIHVAPMSQSIQTAWNFTVIRSPTDILQHDPHNQSAYSTLNLYNADKTKITPEKYDPIETVTRMGHAAAPVGNTSEFHLASHLAA